MVHELTQGISQLKCLSSCCENGLTLVRSYKGSKEYDPESGRYNLLILAVGGDGPSPSSKSIRSQNLSRWSVQIDSSELCDTLTYPIGLGVNLTRDLTEAKWRAYETMSHNVTNCLKSLFDPSSTLLEHLWPGKNVVNIDGLMTFT